LKCIVAADPGENERGDSGRFLNVGAL